MRTWLTWEHPDKDAAVAKWTERGIAVVFPLRWTRRHPRQVMLRRAQERIREVETKAGRMLVPGSVLLAFKYQQSPDQMLDPEVPRGL